MSTTREFILVTHDLDPLTPIAIDDLPGSGRVDLIARTVTAALLLSHGIRPAAQIHIIVDDAYTITVDGAEMRHLHPDERSTAAQIGNALAAHTEVIGAQPTPVSPGLSIRRGGLASTLSSLPSRATPLRLAPEGQPLASLPVPTHPVCVLSDHRSFTDEELAVLEPETIAVSVGPQVLHGADVVTVVHNYLDTAGFAVY